MVGKYKHLSGQYTPVLSDLPVLRSAGHFEADKHQKRNGRISGKPTPSNSRSALTAQPPGRLGTEKTFSNNSTSAPQLVGKGKRSVSPE